MCQLTNLAAFCAALLPFHAHAQSYKGQELIRNGSFEMVDGKPKTYDQFNMVTAWSNATLGLSEIFIKGGNPKFIGIPVNDYGTMDPMDGEFYAGFFGWKDDVKRNVGNFDPEDMFKPLWGAYSEYLTSELVAPLEKGKTYELVFRVALSQNSDRSILGLGAHFSRDPVKENHRKFLEHIPDVYLKDIITEKGKWVEVRGRFKSLGGERFIVLGVFPYVGLDSEQLIEGYDNRYAYYYIDGVSMREVELEEGF